MANHNDLDVKILTGFHGNPLILTKELENKTPTVTKKGELFILSRLEPEDIFIAGIESGGCHGLQYFFKSETNPNYEELTKITDRIYVDTASLSYMWGSVIDLKESISGNILDIKNPYARQSCGCGESFGI